MENQYEVFPVLLLEHDFSLPGRPTSIHRGQRNLNNIIQININKTVISNANDYFYVPKLLLTNTMSLAPKIDEVSCFVTEKSPDLACITETWLNDRISDSCLDIPGYNFVHKNRSVGSHGGVGVYIRNTISYKPLNHLHHTDYEVLWVYFRPSRLPRGFSCLILGVVYHPPNANDDEMLQFLSTSLITIESTYPGCGFILAGDFNRLKCNRILTQFSCKQIVNVSTRANQTLDLIITNLHSFYDKNSVEKFPPFGLSDHNVVIVNPCKREPNSCSRRIISRRDLRSSKRHELGRYLTSIDWSSLNHFDTCEMKLQYFEELVRLGISTIMPIKKTALHVHDPPWITAEFKELIRKRQAAFCSGNTFQFKYYRNRVNRERKSCRAKFYSSKVKNLKSTKPKRWWKEVKQIAGMVPTTGSDDICSQLHLDDIENMQRPDIANLINNAFLEPMNSFNPLSTLPPFDNYSSFQVNELEVFHLLKAINRGKASGPDEIPNWALKEYAEILAQPVCAVLNSSYAEQQLPKSWKLANIVPLIKTKPVSDICKQLRPISLTAAISKIAEDCVVKKYIAPAIMSIIDPSQYGVIPRSSTTLAVISMIHEWSQATDGTGSAVRVILFDYRKAFDLIDHALLADKISNLAIPRAVARWTIDFLMNRKQRVKLSNDCYSEWGDVLSGIPQGTKLGPWLFCLMINDLDICDISRWKFVDDTTVAEVVSKDTESRVQVAVDVVEDWSKANGLSLNAEKCKELRIDFKKIKQPFDPVLVGGEALPIVENVKILGLVMTDTLQWKDNIRESIKKANKRLYFIVLLKRAGVNVNDVLNFYCTVIRPVLEYCAQAFHHSIPKYLADELETVQKRVLKILSPVMTYCEALEYYRLPTLFQRREDMCDKLFTSIIKDPMHKLHHLLPPKNETDYSFRTNRYFNMYVTRTNRFHNSFIPAMCRKFVG